MKSEFTKSVVLPSKPAGTPVVQASVSEAATVAKPAIVGAPNALSAIAQDAQRKSTALDDTTASKLQDVVDKLNLGSNSIGRSLRFQFDDEANTSVIKVYDRETEQLIRQIPSEEALDRLRRAGDDIFQLIEVEA